MVLFTIIGSLIGAGFASGQEIYLFFYRFGIHGIAGILLCSIIISYIIYKTLILIYTNNIQTYKEFLNHIFRKRKKLIKITNIIINTFLCISFFIMVSGFGTYLEQDFGIDNIIGSAIIAIICYIVFLKDIKSIAKINSLIIPILIIVILIVGIKNVSTMEFSQIGANIEIDKSPFWILQAIIYASYNLILVLPVLVNLKQLIKNKKQITIISIMTGIIINIIAILTFLLLVNVDINFSNLEMPIIYVIKSKFTNFRYIYGVIILIAIFSTAISVGKTFLENTYPQTVLILCITSVIISPIGFSNLVKMLFPLFGFLGLMQILFIFLEKAS